MNESPSSPNAAEEMGTQPPIVSTDVATFVSASSEVAPSASASMEAAKPVPAAVPVIAPGPAPESEVRALVLSGGGALGAYEAGAITALFEGDAPKFDLICGTSIGAINAAIVAQGRAAQLASVWGTIGGAKVITLLPIPNRIFAIAKRIVSFSLWNPLKIVSYVWHGLLDFGFFFFQKQRDLLTMLGAIDPSPVGAVIEKQIDFARLQTGLIVCATNLTKGESDAFYWFPKDTDAEAFVARHDKGTARPLTADNIRKAVQASASIPFAFAPQSIPNGPEEVVYVDGGVANNTPIGVAIDAGATHVTTIFLNPAQVPGVDTAISNLGVVGLACFSIMQSRILDLDFANARRVNEAIASAAGGTGSSGARRPVGLCEVRPANTLPVTVLQFDKQELIDAAFARGLADGRAHVKGGCA